VLTYFFDSQPKSGNLLKQGRNLSATALGYQCGGTALPVRRHLAANAVPPRWQ